MKYKYLKGSEKDFEGAPEWAHQVIKSTSIYGYAFVDEFDHMCKYQSKEHPYDIGNISNPTLWEVIAERRPITEPSWDGIGLPPVGCECEAMISNPASVVSAWRKVKVVHIGWSGSKCEALVFDVETKYPSWADELRPIRSEADKKRAVSVEAMNAEWRAHAGKERDGKLYSIYEIIHDAIAAGKIPGVKLED